MRFGRPSDIELWPFNLIVSYIIVIQVCFAVPLPTDRENVDNDFRSDFARMQLVEKCVFSV